MPAKKKKPSGHKIQASSNLPAALVAGAAGFIGSHLCDVLLHQNCRVYGLDNWSTGKKVNLEPLLDNPHFIFIEHNLNQAFKTPPPQVDYIFHLAGIEAYINGLDVSLETLLVNSLGSRELLEIAKNQQAKFLLASTADIFSGFISQKNLNQYFGSDHKDEEVYSHHEAKRFSEALTFEYLNRYQIDARVVRLANVYGPHMDLSSGQEISQLFQAVKTGRNLKVSGQGLTPLYPTYISDIVYGLTKAMFSQSSSGHIYTLIDPNKTTSLNFATAIKAALPDKDIKIEFASDTQDPAVLNLSEAVLESQTALGWLPKVSLQQGISQTLNWLTSGQTTQPLATEPQPDEINPPEPIYTPETLGLKPDQPSDKPIPKKKFLSLPKLKLNLKLKFKLPKISKKINLSLKPGSGPDKISRRFKIGLTIFFLSLFWLFGPIVLLAASTYSGAMALKKASQITDFSRISQLEKLTAKAQSRFNLSQRLLRQSHPTFRLFGLKNLADNFDRLLFIGTKLSQGALHLVKAGDSATLLSEIVFHHQDGNISEALKRIQINLDQAYSELSFVESELQSGRELKLDITASLTKKFQVITAQLPQIRSKINQARTILPLVPSLIAEDSKKTYLLLFQNSAELRPTGGFIGSYGLLTFEKGKLLDLDVQDIYSADGQLQGYIKPPQPIEKFLGQNTWFFRDSNWDPDFVVSAARAEWFLSKTTNRRVDGVIAVNLPAVKFLLQATGPINLPDFSEEITSDNLFERAEYQSEINFFPGSTQKKDFIGALSREIFNRAKNSSAADMLKFAQAFEAALAQKQLLVYLHDQNSQRLLLEQNWAGNIYSPSLATLDNRPITSDYAFLVEANLGINKANYFLKRDIKHQLTILKNKEVLVSTNISYQNQSPADTWPGGVYRSYLRDYLPLNSQLIGIKVGDSKLNLKTLDQEVVADKLVIGFPLAVPVKNSLEVEITYRLPQPLELTNKQGRLAVVIPKQPGILSDNLEVILNYPTFLTVAAVNPQALISPQVVTFQSNLETDRVFLVDLIER